MTVRALLEEGTTIMKKKTASLKIKTNIKAGPGPIGPVVD
jgi:hypothetical protein